MSIFSDTVTVYNYYPYIDGAVPKARFNRTVIRGVSWKDKTNHGVSQEGISRFDTSVSITIPVNASVSSGKKYILPMEYEALPIDDLNYWTLNPKGGSNGSDIVVLGECDEEITDVYTIKMLKQQYRACDIQAVSDNTRNNHLAHWAVIGV